MPNPDPPNNLYTLPATSTQLPAVHPPTPAESPLEPAPAVLFHNRADVLAFIQQRIAALSMTQSIVAAHLGYETSGPLGQLFRGRRLFSRSRHFYALCTLLHVTPEERKAIQRAERPVKR